MRISDWSSDVCSSDLPDPEERALYFPRFGVDGLEWPARIASWIDTRLVDLQTGDTITEPARPGELLLRGATVFAGYFRAGDRQSVVEGQSVSVRVDLGGRRFLTKNKKNKIDTK